MTLYEIKEPVDPEGYFRILVHNSVEFYTTSVTEAQDIIRTVIELEHAKLGDCDVSYHYEGDWDDLDVIELFDNQIEITLPEILNGDEWSEDGFKIFDPTVTPPEKIRWVYTQDVTLPMVKYYRSLLIARIDLNLLRYYDAPSEVEMEEFDGKVWNPITVKKFPTKSTGEVEGYTKLNYSGRDIYFDSIDELVAVGRELTTIQYSNFDKWTVSVLTETGSWKQVKLNLVNAIKFPSRTIESDFVSRYGEPKIKLGSGSYANVYEAEFNNVPVAVKVIPRASKDQVINSDLIELVVATATKGSSNVIEVLDHLTTSEAVFTAMPKADMSLSYLRHLDTEFETIPYKVREKYCYDICHGLYELHSKNVLHLDIKLENLLVFHDQNGDPIVKYTDFGLSKLAHSNGRMRATAFTPGYVDPEHEQGVESSSDIWAVGVAMYEILTGVNNYKAQGSSYDDQIEEDKYSWWRKRISGLDIPGATPEQVLSWKDLLSQVLTPRIKRIDDLRTPYFLRVRFRCVLFTRNQGV